MAQTIRQGLTMHFETVQTQYLTELLTALNPLFMAIFLFGIFTGVFLFSGLMNRIDRLSIIFRQPKRIKAFDQINRRYFILYRFRGKYYGSEEFQSRRKEAIASYKSFHKKDLS